MTIAPQPVALISVTDKSGVAEFASNLKDLGFKILSTGGTAKAIRDAGTDVTDVALHTNSPEILNGRVKTLHPVIHGGILMDRSNPDHISQAASHGIVPIDLVVVNLYNFAANAKGQNLNLEKAIEFIDIGGPTMLRAAAKNFEHCAPVIDPKDYPRIIEELKTDKKISKATRTDLAYKTFASISAYDGMISDYFSSETATSKDESQIELSLDKAQDLRYGENPHQKAGFYRTNNSQHGFANFEILNGKELSYNNYLDLNAATELVSDFTDDDAVAIIKHTNPCGMAIGKNDLCSTYRRALACDPKSAFGGIIACNTSIDAKTAQAITEHFIECIAAPDFDADALEILKSKKNLRLLKMPHLSKDQLKNRTPKKTFRSINGGMLVQDEDFNSSSPLEWQTVTKAQPSEQQMRDLVFANIVCKHVKSNAIVYVRDEATVAIGAGQMSRIDAATFAAEKALAEGKDLTKTILASDAFFPFRDTVDLAAKYGVCAVVQPGGSKKDQESIDACNEHQMSMVFSGRRHFKH